MNIYGPNIRAPKNIKKMLVGSKEEIDNNRAIVGHLTPHCHYQIDLPDKKVNKKIATFNNTLDQMDLIDI